MTTERCRESVTIGGEVADCTLAAGHIGKHAFRWVGEQGDAWQQVERLNMLVARLCDPNEVTRMSTPVGMLPINSYGMRELLDYASGLRAALEEAQEALRSLADSAEHGFFCWCSDGDEFAADSTDPTQHAVICNRARAALGRPAREP